MLGVYSASRLTNEADCASAVIGATATVIFYLHMHISQRVPMCNFGNQLLFSRSAMIDSTNSGLRKYSHELMLLNTQHL